MLTFFQAIILGILQGISELFPISSLGHSVILPKLLGWSVNQKDTFFLIFLVATHFATALVLFLFFIKDWQLIIKGIISSLKSREISSDNPYEQLGWLLIIGTIPAGILGLLFEDTLKNLFSSPSIAAIFLASNGLLLMAGETLRRKKSFKQKNNLSSSDQRIAKISWQKALIVGSMQSIALLPGFSRTGAAIVGSLIIGLSHEDAARFSFLLATPIIGAAALLKLPELISSANTNLIMTAAIGATFSGIFAYIAVKFLTNYFKTNTLTPFAIYCVTAGVFSSLVLFFR